MRHISKIICQSIAFLMMISGVVFPQPRNVQFERIPVAQGLSQHINTYILQDKRGFMWFGSWNGLVKYDGYSATVYKHDTTNPHSLSDNHVNSICEDRSGKLWIATQNGLNWFDHETERFRRYQLEPDNPGNFIDDVVECVYEDKSGFLWLGTERGLYKLNTENETVKRYIQVDGNPGSLSSNHVLLIYEDKSGNLWIGTSNGLNRFDPEQEKFESFKNKPGDSNSLPNNFIRSLFEDNAGNLWIGTANGLCQMFRGKGGTITFSRFEHNTALPNYIDDGITALFEDRRGNLWIGATRRGLNILNRQSREWHNYIPGAGSVNQISRESVMSIYEDRQGVLWIGTWRGVYKADLNKMQFTHYWDAPENPGSTLGHAARSVFVDESENVWIGTRAGLSNLTPENRKNNEWINFRHLPKNSNSLSHNIVQVIYEDKSGILWVGTQAGGLNRFDRKNQKWNHYRYDPLDANSLGHNNVLSIYEDSAGKLWVGTGGGVGILHEFEPVTESFTRYQNDPENPHSLSASYAVFAIYEDRSGTLWIGTDGGGLNRFDREKNQFFHIQHEPGNLASLNSNLVYTIHEDQTGNLWIGSEEGLDKLDTRTEKMTNYLYSEQVYGILEDGGGNFWFSSINGIFRFNPTTGAIKKYTVKHGDDLTKYLRMAYSRSPRTGEMFFGNGIGLTAFHPDSIKDNPYVPNIVITDFLIFNKSVPIAGSNAQKDDLSSPSTFTLEKSITATQKIVLTHKQSVFSFAFAALHFAAPEKNQYAYKMEGFDNAWNHIGNRRFTTFTNLPAGEYTFRVKASNNDGVWNEDGASIKVIIRPPPWRTWWAYTLYIVFAATLIIGVTRFQLNRARLRHELALERQHAEKLAEIDRMKSRFFANISHEFRTPLTLILGPLEKLLSGGFEESVKAQFRLMQRNGKRLLRLIVQLLDLSRLESGEMSLKAQPLDIIKFLKGIVLSFSSLAERKKIHLSFEAPDEPLIVYVDRDKLEKIISNLLSNAFKFTPERGKVSVQLSVSSNQSPANQLISDNCILITVRDSGIGIPQDSLPHIFDRFYQAHEVRAGSISSSQTRERAPLGKGSGTNQILSENVNPTGQEGTGIGLALTKELVEIHYGKIEVSSEPGMGTTFTVRLPMGKEHLKQEQIIEEAAGNQSSVFSDEISVTSGQQPAMSTRQPATSDERPVSGNEQPVLLIVEDNADVRAYIEDYLKHEYKIIEAGDGELGVEKAVDTIPDLVISDVMMPKMDGYELCRKLKTDERTSHIPVILLTARASGESKVEGLETGADDYVTKPFDARELQARVKNLVEQRRKLRERFRKEITLHPKEIAITSLDEEFLQRAMDVIEENMSDPSFSTQSFARKIGLSRMQLNRKLRALTDQSTHEFIRVLRLKHAAQLLQQHAGTVTEITYQVGFNSLSHFAKAFREQFGQSPAEFAASHSPE